MRPSIISALIALATLSTPIIPADAIAATKKKKASAVPKADLATTLAGDWRGEITSGAGGPQSNVGLTITRAGPNLIKITSESKRLPEVTVPLQRVPEGRIIARSGDTIIFYDAPRNPPVLEVTYRGNIAWRGTR
jgi:hypothetical protein